MPDDRSKLAEYRRKRSFADTPDPSADAAEPAGDGGRARFVIQEHSATRLHWDLRLERDGVLASWALPRGLPHTPDQNRLAVHTEDHPLSYLDFEGTIPEGNYGAGTMRIVDQGTYRTERAEEGKLVIELDGERIAGRYALFRTGGRNWMIHGMDPPPAGWTPLPTELEPMEAVDAERPPEDPDAWSHEIEWGGIRVLAYCDAGKLGLQGPEGDELTDLFPEHRGLLRQLGIRDALLDAEIAALDGSGRPDRDRLDARLALRSDGAIRRRAGAEPAVLIVGDLLHLDGDSLLDRPFSERRERLRELGLDGPAWRTASTHVGDSDPLLRAAAVQGVEAIIAKRLDSPYTPGRGGGEWLRLRAVAAAGGRG
jgi:bifunctional non-homologous end joining protein LigD